MTNNQQADPESGPGTGAPSGQQPPSQQPQEYPPQPAQGHPPQAPPQQAQEYASQPYPPQTPPQQYPPAYPGQPYAGQPYPGQQQNPFAAPLPYSAPGASVPDQSTPSQSTPGQFTPGQFTPGQFPQAPYQQAPYPQAPAQQQPYPQGPQQPPYPPAGYAPMPEQPQTPRGKGRLILGITAGVAVLAIVAAFLVPRLGVPQAVGPLPSGSATVVVQTATAESAVQGYLEALAQADAATALAYAADVPGDTSMLTNEVLAAGVANAPLSDIQVTKGSGGSSSDSIDATYRLGDRTVSASFPVARVGSAWLLERPVARVALASVQPDSVALSLNGTPITSQTLVLFPGSYAVTSDDTRYGVSDGTFLVESPDDRPDTYSMLVALSVEGRTAVRAAAQKKLTSCISKRSLKPDGCGFATRLPAGNKARTSTIRWKIIKGGTAMKKLKPSVNASDPTLVSANVNVQVRVNFRSTNGRGWYGNSSIYVVRADLSESTVEVSFG